MAGSKPCAKCRRLIYASVWHTCSNEACYYHIPCRVEPLVDPQASAGEKHVKVLQQLRANYATNTAVLESVPTIVSAIDAAIAALKDKV